MKKTKTKLFIPLFIFQLCMFGALAQSGPGGVGDTLGNSSLQLWLRAFDLDVIHTDGDIIGLWNDQSGAEHHVFSENTTAPTYRANAIGTYAGVVFDGGQYMKTAAESSGFSNPESTIFVVKSGEFSGASVAVARVNWFEEMLLLDLEQYHHSSSGNFKNLGHQCVEEIPDDEFTIICGVFGQETTDLKYFVNGAESTESVGSSPGDAWDYSLINRKVTIGQRDQIDFTKYLKGTLVEVIIYNKKLTDEERLSVEEYLRCTYEVMPSVCTELSDEACPMTTSSTSINNMLEFSLRPNPTSDYIVVDILSDSFDPDMTYMIYDQLGRELKTGQINGRKQISVQDLTAGVYYFKLNYKNEVLSKKFIVNSCCKF